MVMSFISGKFVEATCVSRKGFLLSGIELSRIISFGALSVCVRCVGLLRVESSSEVTETVLIWNNTLVLRAERSALADGGMICTSNGCVMQYVYSRARAEEHKKERALMATRNSETHCTGSQMKVWKPKRVF